MANHKCSLSYYTVDTDRYQDRKIKRLKKTYGGVGVAIYDYLLCEIYRDRGWYIDYDEDTIFDVSEYWAIPEDEVSAVISYCAGIGLFDAKMFYDKSIITSASIQRRYIDMSTRAKRKGVKIPEEYNIIPEESHIIPEESVKVPEKSPQRKEKKSKINKTLSISPSLGDSESSGSHSLTEEEREKIVFSFFWRNIKNYEEEADRFINHYSATGWVRKGEQIRDKIALARSWETKTTSVLFPPAIMSFWQAVADRVCAVGENERPFVKDIHRLEVKDKVLYVYGNKPLLDILLQNSGTINEEIKPIAEKWMLKLRRDV